MTAANDPPIRSLKDVRAEFDRLVQQYFERFSQSTVSEIVKDILTTRIDDVVCEFLGFEHDDRGWRLKSYGQVNAVMARIHSEVERTVDEFLPEILKGATQAINKVTLNKKAITSYKTEYREAFDELLHDRICEEARKQANMDIDKLFEKETERLIEGVKIAFRFTDEHQ